MYIVHNRVESIYRGPAIKDWFQGRVCVTRQMPEQELEEVMLRFIRRDYDILVAPPSSRTASAYPM